MRTYTGRPHDVRRVGGYENVPRLCLLCSEELPPPGRGAHPRTEVRIRGPEGGEEGWVPVDPYILVSGSSSGGLVA